MEGVTGLATSASNAISDTVNKASGALSGTANSVMSEVNAAATNASTAVNKVLQDASAVVSTSVNAAATKAGEVAKLAQSGVTNLATNAAGQIAGQAAAALGAASNKVGNIVNLGNITQSANSAATKVNISTSPPYNNILHNYASYNYIFTLSVIDKNSNNFPESGYRTGNLGEIILRSASGLPEKRVNTEYGKFDFFMDNVSFNSLISPTTSTGNSFATTAKFTVFEPYSMGMFYQAIETAALTAGYINWVDAVFLLTVEFIGHISGDMQGVHADDMAIDKTTRYFPIKLANTDMTVTGKGSTYNIETYAYNELAFSSANSCMKSNISIAGKTVHEMLQTGEKSLQKVLNDRLKTLAEKDKREPDKIIIYFPKDPATPPPSGTNVDAATSAPSAPGGSVEGKLRVSQGKNETLVQSESAMNPIGSASMEFDFFRPADQSLSKDKEVWDETKKVWLREKVNVDPNLGEMRFAQNANIIDIINQVVLSSGYGRQALEPGQMKNGQVPWWKIDAQVYLLSEDTNITKTGIFSKMIVYRVVPYGIDASKLLSPNADNSMISAVRKAAAKEYNYIYTSKNLDVLNFNIKFDSGFYKANAADLGQNTDGSNVSRQQGNTAEQEVKMPVEPDPGSKPKPGSTPVTSLADQTNTTTANRGGTSYDTPSVTAARRAHDLLLNSVDMTNLDLTILGDPYWLIDSGIGNYVSQQSTQPNINADHAADTQTGDNTIIMNFRTPLDISAKTGAYDFGPDKIVARFSGVYNVTEVESKFNRGKFTQVLKGYRLHGQTGVEGSAPAASGGIPANLFPPKDKKTEAPTSASEGSSE